MKITTSLTILLFALLMSSCSLNKMFLHPTKMDSDATSSMLHIQEDTVIIKYSGANHQPMFIHNGIDTVNFDYTIESVMFESTSGNMLNGWMLTPKIEKPKATLLFFHGNTGYITSHHWSMTILLSYGFQAFVVDYSGYGFSEGKATRKNILKDGNSAITYLKSRPDVEGTKLVIYGQSLGGNLAAVVAEQNQEDIDALVVEGAFSSHRDIGIKFAGILGRIFVKEHYSAVESIANYTKPLLVIHSTEDDVVPFELGKKIYDSANQPKELYEIDGCHTCGARLYPDKIAEKILKMINL